MKEDKEINLEIVRHDDDNTYLSSDIDSEASDTAIEVVATNIDTSPLVSTQNGFEGSTGINILSRIKLRQCHCCQESKQATDFWPSSLWCKMCTMKALLKLKKDR